MNFLDNFEEKMDQLIQLGVLATKPTENQYNVKFESKFMDLFDLSIEKTLGECNGIREILQINSAIALSSLRPELNKSELYLLSHICLFIFTKFYNMTEDNFRKFRDDTK